MFWCVCRRIRRYSLRCDENWVRILYGRFGCVERVRGRGKLYGGRLEGAPFYYGPADCEGLGQFGRGACLALVPSPTPKQEKSARAPTRTWQAGHQRGRGSWLGAGWFELESPSLALPSLPFRASSIRFSSRTFPLLSES